MDILQRGGQIALQVVESKESKAYSLTWDGIKRVLAAYAFPAPTPTSKAAMNRGLA